MIEETPDDIWTPYKHLNKIIGSYLTGQLTETATLEHVLQKYKQNFINLLKSPPKNVTSREEIRKGITDGVSLPNLGHTILSKDLVDETIIVSDMYDLNEYIALQLLCTAQQQSPHHPGLPRGLIAVLLYYDGRKTLVTTLKDLFQVREGISWCVEITPDVIKLISRYIDSLVADGLLNRIIDLLDTLDITKEHAILSDNRALGPSKHRRQISDLFEDIRLQLATILFCASSQCGLSKDTTIKLIGYLSKYKSGDARGGIDDVTLALLMALLYALDLSVFHKREDAEMAINSLPLIAEPNFAADVLDALEQSWECDELRSIVLFALGLAMATLRQAPQILQQNSMLILDKDEDLVNSAIEIKVFDFMYHILLENENIFKTEFYFRRIHILLTDFIELMHSKVTELRTRADDTARTIQIHAEQGLDSPSKLCRNFETLLLIVGKLYSNDQLDLKLDLEYWGPMEVAGNYQRATSRSVSLFKFIRLAGELLPPILFVPYLKMLAGLSSCQQSARNAFNLLKQGSGVSGSTTLSWDHFFSSLARYYTTLRQEQLPVSETIYRNRALSRNINPQEIAGLQAVLNVVRAVATNDDVARIALCEHPSWEPLHVFLGLVSCSISITLKTELLLTLAALARSKETAMQLWVNLESSQIITTIPSTNTFTARGIGIKSDLEQIECRNEAYPLTQALLELLFTLSSTAIPRNLGAGPRKPGLDPYLTFIVDSIFLGFYNRNYKDPAEKWSVAEKCLKILEHFVKIYDVNPVDFQTETQTKEENSPPGFHIILQMNTNEKSELLKLMLQIIDESCTQLDKYAQFPGKVKLEQCALYCLNMIKYSLAQQDLFFEAHFAANCSELMAGLNKLLLGVNRRSGKSDHMLNIVKFVTYNSWLPKHSLAAVEILTFIARQPNVSPLLLGEFTRTPKLTNEIRHGFVECLESDIDCSLENDGELDAVGLSIKESIINLLEECISHSAPNLAYYLLGFNITKDVQLTRLQHPGVLDFPSNCMKSLVMILDEGLEHIKSQQEVDLGYASLIQNAYRLLNVLCFDSRTSDIVLRFLRSCHDFFCRHISALPFRNAQNCLVLNQMTGLLRCVAIELKITADNNQVSQFGNMCKILLGIVQGSPGVGHSSNDGDIGGQQSTFYGTTFGDTTMPSQNITQEKTGDNTAGLLICKLLECFEFEIQSIDRPKWDYFDSALIQQLLQNCETSSGAGGPKLINLKKLHDVLRDELNIVQSTIASGQRQAILQETESVLKYAEDVNTQKNICAATVKYLEAWGQVTETLFTVAPSFSLSHEVKQALILEILQTLLNKVVSADIMPELAILASSTVLQLLVNLRHCHYQMKHGDQSANITAAVLNYTNTTFSTNQSQTLGPLGSSAHTPKTNTLSLKYILKNIVEWIIISGVAPQKLKINLYASLLNFMHILKGNRKSKDFLEDAYVCRLDKSMTRIGNQMDDRNQIQMAIEVFTSVGDKLFDNLCHDCISGHDICKMLALSCIDTLLDLDSMDGFVQFISRRGYLAHLVDSLLKTDNQLCRILENTPDNFKALYVYESKMAMLCRAASSHIGAELLLEQRALGVLSSMKVYDMHPDFQVNNYANQLSAISFIPPVEVRYQQILFPALNLCDVVLSILGPENHSAITQVVNFLLSHGDMIEVVLRAGTPFLNLGLLQELSAITGLIARTANQEMSMLIEPNTNQDLGAHLYRLQKLMLSIFPRFIVSETIMKEMNKTDGGMFQQHSDKDKIQHVHYFLKIACNLALYARNAIANHSADHRTTGVLFSPNINEGVQRNEVRSGTLEVSPSIGVVVSQLRNSVEHYNREKHIYDSLLRQVKSLPDLSLDSKNQAQIDSLNERLVEKQRELKLCIFLTEHCLYLLWAHLDFYMLRAIPINSFQLNANITTSQEAGWKVTSEHVGSLKKALVQVFNEKFSNQLVATAQNDWVTDKRFVEALLRRIKQLVQFVPVK